MSSYDGLSPGQRKLLDESVHEIGLPVRTANHLEEREVFTVRQLLECSREELLAIPNFGEKTLSEVYRLLGKFGIYRPGHAPATPAPGDPAAKPKPQFKLPAAFKPRVSQFREKKPKKPKE